MGRVKWWMGLVFFAAVAGLFGKDEAPLPEKPLSEWRDQLSHRDDKKRVEAARALYQMGKKAAPAAEELASQLGDKHHRVRFFVLRSLSTLAEKARPAVPAIVRRLDDPIPSVRIQALETLVGLGKVAVPEVVKGLADKKRGKVRMYSAYALGKMGPPAKSSYPALVRALQDRFPLVRKGAVWSLVQLKVNRPEVVEKMSHLLSDSSPVVRREVAWGLGKLGRTTDKTTIRLVGSLGDSSRPVRLAATWSLGQLGDSRPAVIRGLVIHLGDGDIEVRKQAARSLGRLGREAHLALPFLRRLTAVEREWSFRLELATALWQVQGTSTGADQVLVKGLAHDDRRWRSLAVDNLAQLGQKYSQPVKILARALSDSDPYLRRQALGHLEKLGPRAAPAVPELTRALNSRDQCTRRGAIRTLGEIGPAAEKSRQALLDLAQRSEKWKEEVDKAVRKIEKRSD